MFKVRGQMFSQIDSDILSPGLCLFTDRMLVHIQNLAQNSVSEEMVWLIFEYFPRPNAFSWHGIGQFWDKWIPKFKIHPTAFVPCTNCLKYLIFRYSFSQIPYQIMDSKFRTPFVGTVVPHPNLPMPIVQAPGPLTIPAPPQCSDPSAHIGIY